MRVAIVYDRVNKWGGAERVLLALHDIFPEAPLFTSVYDTKKAPWAKVFPKVIPSFLQKVPFAKRNHEFLGFLTPIAFESFNFDKYDLVISVTSEAAKGILTKPNSLHICYCLTPTRYLWSGFKEYLENPPSKFSWIPFYKFLARPILNYVKKWDKVAAQRPDIYLAISSAVQSRINRFYNRDARIVFPPCEVDIFKPENGNSGRVGNFPLSNLELNNYYLTVARLIPYKKVDLAIQAFNKLGKPLVVIGTGTEEARLKGLSKKNIQFIKYITDSELAEYYRFAKALVFPGEEDFGIVMVEALSSGIPVIAYKKGGALDIVRENKNGIFFTEQTAAGLTGAIRRFEKHKFDKKMIMRSAVKFSVERFKREFLDIVKKSV